MPKGIYQRVKSTEGDFIERAARAFKRPKTLSLIELLPEQPMKSNDPSIYRVRCASGFILRGRY